MSDTGQNQNPHPPSPSRECRDRDGYHCCFYPGWLRKASVRRNGETVVIYDQDRTFYLPGGSDRPFTLSQVEFRGPGGHINLTVDDPRHLIDRIEVVFKKKEREGGEEDGDGDEDGDMLILENAPVVCPPAC
jgi:hypothetical protein